MEYYKARVKDGPECWEAMRSMVGSTGFQAFLRCNVLKYLWRFPDKKSAEDLSKAEWYLHLLLAEVKRIRGEGK